MPGNSVYSALRSGLRRRLYARRHASRFQRRYLHFSAKFLRDQKILALADLTTSGRSKAQPSSGAGAAWRSGRNLALGHRGGCGTEAARRSFAAVLRATLLRHIWRPKAMAAIVTANPTAARPPPARGLAGHKARAARARMSPRKARRTKAYVNRQARTLPRSRSDPRCPHPRPDLLSPSAAKSWRWRGLSSDFTPAAARTVASQANRIARVSLCPETAHAAGALAARTRRLRQRNRPYRHRQRRVTARRSGAAAPWPAQRP